MEWAKTGGLGERDTNCVSNEDDANLVEPAGNVGQDAMLDDEIPNGMGSIDIFKCRL